MRTCNKLIFIVFCLIVFQLDLFSQKAVRGTYIGRDHETIIIENDSFKILSDRLNPEIDENDRIISSGSIKFYPKNFMEFNSIDYNCEVSEGTIFSESYDPNIKDSLFIKFSFPFSGKYKIEIHFLKKGLSYELINSSEIILPIRLMKNESVRFTIFKQNILFTEPSGNYYKMLAFNYYPSYHKKNDDSNCIFISIPGLTNKFFQYYYIQGEYVRFENETLWWRGNYYEKINPYD